jgi:hypothetical protein
MDNGHMFRLVGDDCLTQAAKLSDIVRCVGGQKRNLISPVSLAVL